MTTDSISIGVDPETARAFASASPEVRRKLELLLGLRLRELTVAPSKPLTQLMDEIGAEAAARGLTLKTLESLLNDRR